MSYSAYEQDDNRLAYETLLARNAWGKPNVEAELGDAVLQARRGAWAHGGIIEQADIERGARRRLGTEIQIEFLRRFARYTDKDGNFTFSIEGDE